MFRGSIPALITPFNSDGTLDESALRDFVEWQISEGSHGLVPVGTTGESPTLSHDEHKRVVEICVEVANKRVPVIAGAGSNNTAEAIDLATFADKAGADAVLVVTPYYNKPSQRGMIAHFGAIADAISIPLIIYNIPSRSIVDMSIETMAELYEKYDNIVGIKDATGAMERLSEQRHVLGLDFLQLTGNDDSALGFMAHGGAGCISVSANVAPRLCSQFQEACMAGRFEEALAIQDKLAPLHKALFLEPNPGGAKYALSLLGKVENHQRLPLVPVSAATEANVRDAMVHAGLIN
ncbi:MAG: 4-hydroxy-tetrahydrodipicolinate synthase [Hyphomicrobiales bacterium]|nr:MAG: 4-hydroxy-tetrahydrodipicolinate synthase [Hyphomicrobiales bacterium]